MTVSALAQAKKWIEKEEKRVVSEYGELANIKTKPGNHDEAFLQRLCLMFLFNLRSRFWVYSLISNFAQDSGFEEKTDVHTDSGLPSPKLVLENKDKFKSGRFMLEKERLEKSGVQIFSFFSKTEAKAKDSGFSFVAIDDLCFQAPDYTSSPSLKAGTVDLKYLSLRVQDPFSFLMMMDSWFKTQNLSRTDLWKEHVQKAFVFNFGPFPVRFSLNHDFYRLAQVRS